MEHASTSELRKGVGFRVYNVFYLIMFVFCFALFGLHLVFVLGSVISLHFALCTLCCARVFVVHYRRCIECLGFFKQ